MKPISPSKILGTPYEKGLFSGRVMVLIIFATTILFLLFTVKSFAANHRLEILDTLNIYDKNGNPSYSYEVMHDKKTNVYCYVIGSSGITSSSASMQCLQIK